MGLGLEASQTKFIVKSTHQYLQFDTKHGYILRLTLYDPLRGQCQGQGYDDPLSGHDQAGGEQDPLKSLNVKSSHKDLQTDTKHCYI